LGLYASVSFLAPVRCILDRIIQVTEKTDPLPPQYAKVLKSEDWKLQYVQATASQQTILDVMHHYDWTPADQRNLEKQVATWEPGQPLKNSNLDYLMDRDSNGPRFYYH
jgi:hypothetical protein